MFRLENKNVLLPNDDANDEWRTLNIIPIYSLSAFAPE